MKPYNLIENKSERGILITDDDSVLTDAISELFTKEGYTNIFVAGDAMEVLQVLANSGEMIYVMILDRFMPIGGGSSGNEGGWYVINKLLEKCEYYFGIIMITGWLETSNKLKFMDIKSNKFLNFEYIIKPFRFEVIKNKIDILSNIIYEKKIR